MFLEITGGSGMDNTISHSFYYENVFSKKTVYFENCHHMYNFHWHYCSDFIATLQLISVHLRLTFDSLFLFSLFLLLLLSLLQRGLSCC